jgi:hypothetical protein
MKIEIITSFNESYYNLIGKDCVSSWLKHWPKELSLTCYVEGFTLPPTERIKQISFDNLCKEYFEFQKSNENDRVKIFSKKAYSAIHAFENSDADYIIWIDADVITGKTSCISRLSDGALIPLNPDNTDYQEYLKWVAEGNEPLPAENE